MPKSNENLSIASDQFYIDEIARHLNQGRAAIMVGSGFSINASPDFPSWKKVGDKIFKRLYDREPAPTNIEERYINPMRLAGELESVYGRAALDSIIREIPDTVEPSDVHVKLLELPWTDVFTTNYDTLLERAAIKVNARKYDTVISGEDLACCRSPRIVKLHGSLPSNRSFVFTEEDYRKYPKDNSIFINTVQQSLIENILCLIGFSGDDPNFLNWIGWVRDNLGKGYEPRIYLLDVGNKVSEPQRALLSRRNIIVIDLRRVYEKETDSTVGIVSLLLTRFFDDIGKKIKDNSLEQWNMGKFVSPPLEFTEEALKQIVEEWQTIRNNYPGWIILPYHQRVGLWSLTEFWTQCLRSLSSLPQHLTYNFAYEFAWRADKCLYPLLFQDLAILCDKMVKDVEWRDTNFTKWYEIALLLLREYRQDGKTSQWQEIAALVESVKNKLSPEQTSAFTYEQTLQAVFSLDIPLLRQKLGEWKETKNLPMWEAKRAALWAGLGELEIARPLLDTALATVRSQINSAAPEKLLALLSQEGCILSISQRVEVADALRKEENFSLVSKKYKERREFLRRYHCDLNEEQVVFESALKQEPTAPKEGIQQTDSFDIGRVNRTRNFNLFFNDKDAFIGFSFLNYSEQTGIPFKLANMNFDIPSAVGAAKRIKPYSFHWAFVTLTRCGDSKQFDWFFSRNVLSELNSADIDNYITLCISAVKNSVSEFDKLARSHIDKNLGAEYANTIPEILSRLCTKCSFDSLQKIAEFVVYLYALPEKDKQVFHGINNLVSRLINSYPKNQSEQLFDYIKKIDWKSVANNPIVAHEFLDPYLAFFQHFGDAVKPSPEEIDNALQKLESSEENERENGMVLCFSFQDSFNEEQKISNCRIEPSCVPNSIYTSILSLHRLAKMVKVYCMPLR